MEKEIPRREGRGEMAKATSNTDNSLSPTAVGVNPDEGLPPTPPMPERLGADCWRLESLFTHKGLPGAGVVVFRMKPECSPTPHWEVTILTEDNETADFLSALVKLRPPERISKIVFGGHCPNAGSSNEPPKQGQP